MVNNWSLISHLIGAHCPLCHAPGAGLCVDCHSALPRNNHACPRCALPLPDDAAAGTLCAGCQTAPPDFDRAHVPLRYEWPVDDLVSAFKYRHRLAIGRLLGDLLADRVSRIPQYERPKLLLPVPMHARGLRDRGFNQATELTRRVAARCRIAWSPYLVQRIRQGDHQQALGRKARRSNLKGAFVCHERPPAHVAVVDDVLTTGATASAVSRALHAAGAETVEVWAVARTGRDGPITVR
jgi:ComF family protein